MERRTENARARVPQWRWVTWLLASLLLAGCDESGAPPTDAGISPDAAAGCGDGTLGPGEACDDGNTETGDGCTAACRREAEPAGADAVVEAPGASGMGFGDPSLAVDGVRGGGLTMQSLDVYSIPPGEHLVLGWEGRRVVDGPGVDLVVFENPFRYGDGLTFMDPTVVEVSADGERWVAFEHDYVAEDETVYSSREEDWLGFAGIRPVLLHVDEAPVDPFDPEAAGGDAFDLADLPDADLRRRGIRFVRLSAASAHDNPDTGAPFVSDPVSNGPDIDGVMARYLAEEP